MSISQISYVDLMKECNIDDFKEFRYLLKVNNFRQISPNKLIDKYIAEKIVKRLTNKEINWYKYKHAEISLLDQKANLVTGSLLEKWFMKITKNDEKILPNRNYLLGLVCKGGFLGDHKTSEFILSLRSGMNILIGDRGSGKSTVLNLLSLISNSVSEETDILINKFLSIFKATSNVDGMTFNRRVYKVMRNYSIKEYVIFFALMEEAYCYCVDFENKHYDLLKRQNKEWHSLQFDNSPTVPSIHYLPQGEVTKISGRKSTAYLHDVLDNLYIDLHDKRTKVAQDMNQLIRQTDYYTKTYASFNQQPIEQFIHRKYRELNAIKRDIREGNLTDHSIYLLRSYITSFYEINRSVLPSSVIDLLKGSESSFLYLYVGRIIGFLSTFVKEIESLKQQQESSISSRGNSVLNEVLSNNTETDQFMDDLENDEDVLKEIDETEDEENLKLFLESLLATDSPLNRKILRLTETVIEFLQARLRVLKRCVAIYSSKYVYLSESLKALIKSYIELSESRIDLILLQEEKCDLITKSLNKGEFEINLYTEGYKQVVRRHKNSIGKIRDVQFLFESLLQFSPQDKLRILYDLIKSYNSRIEHFFYKIDNLHKQETQNAFLFTPIEVELKQGNIYRAFHQLSFGQKSGIILKIVLMIPNKHVIVIDQPEDNLDAASIVSMLAPTLQDLTANHQVIIATHSSNLVMGLSNAYLVVLEPLGEYTRIKEKGSLSENNQVVREVLEVLEGGTGTIHQKIALYEKFIRKVQGAIKDIDITAIESSFRRRTIDELRNFLQPIISDKSLLDFVRHELKQPNYFRIQKNIIEIKEELSSGQITSEENFYNLCTKIDKLCTELDKHIIKLKNIIEEIRLMDTHPIPKVVDIYKLLTDLRDDYVSKLFRSARNVQILIDSTFEGILVYADYDHLRLVFRNLLNNALRATERRAIESLISEKNVNVDEVISINNSTSSAKRLILHVKDNGCGMSPEVKRKLYIEQCSDQEGRDHGLGGVIIKKLLTLNHSSIRILESQQQGNSVGTLQEINLPIYIKNTI